MKSLKTTPRIVASASSVVSSFVHHGVLASAATAFVVSWCPPLHAAGAPAALRPEPLPADAPALIPAEICFPPDLAESDGHDDADEVGAEDAEAGPVDGDAAEGEEAPAHADADPDSDADSDAAADAASAVDPEVDEGSAITPDSGHRYSADISDEELKALWAKDPQALGSISVGFTYAGRLINAVPFPSDGNWIVVDPRDSWGTQETIDSIVAAIEQVNERIPNTPPLRVNDISSKEGGWLRGHRSHQAGRDVDLGFYYPTAEPIRIRARETCIDVARNWALVRALVTTGDVKSILVDKRVQAVLYRYAISIGEDQAWLDTLFHGGPDALIQHARRHRDHFHVRYYSGRSQELGRRVQPFLAMRPEHNVTTHRVRRGDTLGHIAKRYGTTVPALKKKNGLKNSFLRLGRILTVPMRGPCTQCPMPPPVVVPPRRLPPDMLDNPDDGEDPGAPLAAHIEDLPVDARVDGSPDPIDVSVRRDASFFGGPLGPAVPSEKRPPAVAMPMSGSAPASLSAAGTVSVPARSAAR